MKFDWFNTFSCQFSKHLSDRFFLSPANGYFSLNFCRKIPLYLCHYWAIFSGTSQLLLKSRFIKSGDVLAVRAYNFNYRLCKRLTFSHYLLYFFHFFFLYHHLQQGTPMSFLSRNFLAEITPSVDMRLKLESRTMTTTITTRTISSGKQ